MKRQIFILVLAIFATVGTAFGQALPGTVATPLTCTTNDPLNPIAGRPYTYNAVINPVSGTAYWYATKSTTFTTAGARVAAEIPADGTAIATGATNYMTSAAAPASPTSTTITWTSAGLAGIDKTTNPLFMVVEYAGPTCSNNIKVMQIVPKIAFTVDITNMTHGTTTSLPYLTAESQCFDMVQSAKMDATFTNVIIDYGTNVLLFEVIGANFTGSYLPTLKLSGLQGTQTAAIDWGYTAGTYDQALVPDQAPTAGVITSSQFTVSTTAPATDKGVSIYVRVTVKNHGWEGIANEDVSLAVEATDNTPQKNKDVMADCTVSATPFEDIATQTLNARPAVTPGTTMMPQVP